MPPSQEPFRDSSLDPPVKGVLHRPASALRDGLVFAHGAGGNHSGALLVALAESFASAGIAFLRCDLPFRQARPLGPPRPGDAAHDRQGLKNAVATLRKLVPGRVFLGGQSYGGRQATMLCAEEDGLVDGLLLTSYPLHPPGKPQQLRVQHFPQLHTPALFIEGTRDPFGTMEEIEAALKLIPANTRLLRVENAGHDLGFKGKAKQEALLASIISEFTQVFG